MQSEPQHARQLIAQLDHPVATQRKAAATALTQISPLIVEPLLSSLLPTASLPMRRRILMVLAQMDAPKAIPGLMQYALDRASDPTDDSRPLALRAILPSLRPRHALHCFDFFLQHRRDPDPLIRAAAFEGLAILADIRAQEILQDSSRNDPDPTARNAALKALTTLSASASSPPSASSPIIEPQRLRELLASRDSEQRALAIRELIRLSPSDALTAFQSALASNHALARESALIGLGSLRNPAVFPALLSVALSDHTPSSERALALRSLALTPPPLPPPLSDLDHIIHSAPDLFVLAAALEAFASLNPPANRLDPILEHLDHPEPFIRDAASAALKRITHNPPRTQP